MKPREPQNDLFKARLEDVVNPAHPLVRLTLIIDWVRLDAELGRDFATVGA